MENYTSTADMLFQMQTRQNWKRENTDYGYILTPPPHLAQGRCIVWGNPESCCFFNTDIVLRTALLERYYYKQKCIQVTFVDDVKLEYYQSRTEIHEPKNGLFCAVNNIPQPWFQRFPAGTRQKAVSVIMTQRFFEEQNMVMPTNVWDRIATETRGKIFIPKIELILRDIKHIAINKSAFDIFLRAKTAEIFALLLNHTLEKEGEEVSVLSAKSREAARRGFEILNENYINPPVIDVLADSLEVDTGTLQKAFKQIAGKTVYEYIVALRMEKALSLLENKSLTVEGIAEAVGYQSKANFYKAFEKAYNCKPGELRKQILNR
ncbi:MAG: AraC family transcriptional regulator [Bacillota bacterium]|nr:AraC family transcriptional regulator [Bacillota bacterium]